MPRRKYLTAMGYNKLDNFPLHMKFRRWNGMINNCAPRVEKIILDVELETRRMYSFFIFLC